MGQLLDSEAFVVSVAKQEACKNRTEGGSTLGGGGAGDIQDIGIDGLRSEEEVAKQEARKKKSE